MKEPWSNASNERSGRRIHAPGKPLCQGAMSSGGKCFELHFHFERSGMIEELHSPAGNYTRRRRAAKAARN
jgi:hypothetical protein